MSATLAPFGFVAVRHPSGEVRMKRYPIASGYATAMYKGQPVILAADGTITVGTAAADIIGILAGVEYVSSVDGKPATDTYWPAGQATTQAYAWVYDDPETEFLVQSDGSLATTALGDQADVSNVGNHANGRSTCTLSSATVAAASQGQFRVVSFDLSPDNAAGDTYTKVVVKIARHQYRASKAAF